MKEKNIPSINSLKEKIKELKEEIKANKPYKKLILTAARSKYEPKDVVAGLKFAVKLINKKKWHLVEKIGGTSGDLMVRGMCPKCDINLVGKELKPRDFTLPCLINGCPFNKQEETKGIK